MEKPASQKSKYRAFWIIKEKILKGSFKTLTDLERCYMISAEKFEELKAMDPN